MVELSIKCRSNSISCALKIMRKGRRGNRGKERIKERVKGERGVRQERREERWKKSTGKKQDKNILAIHDAAQ